MRQQLTLDGLWKFCPAFVEIANDQRGLDPHYDPAHPEPVTPDADRGWIEPAFDDSGWMEMPVPSSWNKAVPALWSYEGLGWYRRRVIIPEDWAGRRVFFFSEGTNYRTVVYVNGQLAGAHDGGYNPFSIPIEPYLKPGQENVLAVSCDNVPKPGRVPGGKYDWWNHGGLYRSVSLVATGDAIIEHATIMAALEGGRGRVRIIVVAQAPRASSSVRCRVHLYDPGGTPIALDDAASAQSAALVEGRADLHFDVTVDDAKPWSPEHPNLYTARIILLGEDGWEDEREIRFGIRSLEVRGTQLLLNGEPLLIKGVNRYEDYPTTGRSLDEGYMAADLARVKSLGANTIRCHFPNHRRHYELCDEMGILNLAELPLYHWGGSGARVDLDEALAAAKLQLEEMIRNLGNHPCVFMWSVSNENNTRARGDQPEETALAEQVARGNIELVELAKRLDPTRPVVEVSNRWPADPVLEHTEVLAVNVYVGAEGGFYRYGLPGLQAEMKRRVMALREKYPDRPILAGEFGAWCVRGLHTDYFPGEEYQAEMLRAFWTGLMEVPGVIGGIIWQFADADIHRRFDSVYELHVSYGLYDFERRPKASVETMRELWGGSPPE